MVSEDMTNLPITVKVTAKSVFEPLSKRISISRGSSHISRQRPGQSLEDEQNKTEMAKCLEVERQK
jgi:hypothetical protein